jgi:hypothetical protein
MMVYGRKLEQLIKEENDDASLDYISVRSVIVNKSLTIIKIKFAKPVILFY